MASGDLFCGGLRLYRRWRRNIRRRLRRRKLLPLHPGTGIPDRLYRLCFPANTPLAGKDQDAPEGEYGEAFHTE